MTADRLHEAAVARVTALATQMGTELPALTKTLHKVLADSIEDLQGDQLIVELLGASIESNLETVAHILRYDVAVDEVATPFAAEEYARRLAQRGIAPIALVRAYRLGQQQVLDWAFDELGRDADQSVALAAGRIIVDTTFRYIDRISEQVVTAYESERVRWLANRNTLRKAMIEELLRGEPVDLAAAEGCSATGSGRTTSGSCSGVRRGPVATRTSASSNACCSRRPPRLVAQGNRCSCRGTDRRGGAGSRSAGAARRSPWPVTTTATVGSRSAHPRAVPGHAPGGAAGSTGRAGGGERARRVTTFSDPQVRTAAMMAADLEGTRRLVRNALGPLAADSEAADRLRETLLVFLAEKGSYLATAERIHLHKNTVKYRVDKALEERGRPLDDERLELELALVACRWLAASVLMPPAP